jgi:hypothetical protein
MPVSAHKYKVADQWFRPESFFAEGDQIVSRFR